MINQINLQKFESIYDKTYKNVLKFVICECSNMSDVNDIIQEVYIEVYKKINVNDDIKNIEAYIIGIAKNKIKKYYRLLYKFKTLSLNKENDREEEFVDNIPSDIDIEKIIIKTDDLEIIWKFLRKQKLVIQKIFYLYYELDFTIKEIANVLHLSESYIKNNLYRTLKSLQKIMKEE